MTDTKTLATKTFPHGVHPPEHKEATADKPVVRLPFAPELVVPLSQHIGAPAKAIVEARQEVGRGERIADPGGFVSVPMHAPAAGTVKNVSLAPNANGGVTPSIFLRVDEEASQEAVYGEPQDVDAMSPEELIQAVQAAGLVGLGGAAFPTHVKLAVPEGKSVDTIIVNGCECEPYLTTDHRVMLEKPQYIFAGIRVALRATGAEQAIIGVESNKVDAAEILINARPDDMPARVEVLKVKYPQGAEKMLSEALLGREVPSGGLPSDVGVGCFNVATLAQIGELLPKGQGLIERVVTVSGPAIEHPGNYLIPIGTPLRFVLEHAGFTGSAKQVILGGPMMGASVASLDAPVTKGVTGILVLSEEEVRKCGDRRIYPCIKCGACVEACPIFLNPSRLGELARKGMYEVMEEKYHLNDCFECGSCAYVCPSNIPLVQYFRMAKAHNREKKARK